MKALFAGAIALSSVCFTSQDIQVRVEQRTAVWDTPPAWSNGVAMVPVRGTIEAMDGTMKWNMATRTLTCWRGGHKFDVVLNSRSARIDGKEAIMEEAAFIQRGRIYVPLRFIAEAAGYMVSQEDGWFVLRPART